MEPQAHGHRHIVGLLYRAYGFSMTLITQLGSLLLLSHLDWWFPAVLGTTRVTPAMPIMLPDPQPMMLRRRWCIRDLTWVKHLLSVPPTLHKVQSTRNQISP